MDERFQNLRNNTESLCLNLPILLPESLGLYTCYALVQQVTSFPMCIIVYCLFVCLDTQRGTSLSPFCRNLIVKATIFELAFIIHSSEGTKKEFRRGFFVPFLCSKLTPEPIPLWESSLLISWQSMIYASTGRDLDFPLSSCSSRRGLLVPQPPPPFRSQPTDHGVHLLRKA
jgi:hypothetical protein